MTTVLERIADIERQLIVEEGFAPLEQALPASGLAGQQFHACLARQGRQRIDLHAFLAWQGQAAADLRARASALRAALDSAVAFFSGRVAVTLFLMAETEDGAKAALAALASVESGHFLEKIQFAVASADLSTGQLRYKGRLEPEPGQDWFEARLQSAPGRSGSPSPEEVRNILSQREDEEQSSRRFLSMSGLPWATYILIALNACMFAAVFLLALQYAQAGGGRSMSAEDWQLASLNMGMNEGSLVFGLGQYWRLLACIFLHGGLIHLGMNMVSLYSLGALVERIAGPWRMLLIYFCAGLLGSLASTLVSPAPSLGASGAILGLAGALLALHWRRPSGFPKVLAERIYGSLWRPVAFIFVLGLGLRAFDAPVLFDNWCHLGGLCSGFAMVFLRPGLLQKGLDRLG